MFGQGFFGKEFPEPTAKYSPRTYVCYKTKTPIVIDGKMDESSWENTDWTQLFVDIEGNKKPDPYFETRLKMLWDEKYFYFGAILEEPHVWATLTMRDAVIFKDNDFEIFLDPDGDTHNYYELEVNAFETEWDLILIKPYHDQAKVAVDSWDIPGLITKVHVDGSLNDPSDTDKGWNLEIAIPWKALEECAPNFHPQEGEQWKVNFSRVQWDVEIIEDQYVKTDAPEHNWVWSPQGLIYMHMPELWGIVQFTQAPPEQGNVEFQESKIDQIKWALRQVYYGQRNYFFKNDRYTASLKELNLIKKPVEDVPWPPKIVLTPSGWEAVAQWTDRSILIRKDGKVWVE
ncbi:MAG: carbohydrate-binding family 9-like protein [Candidatus Marinimicrobia bacterium]|nr:carbohydrate-binding family 9-like protein [Candidatus Neomarinimicrobiota bacterium]|tara:strand:- start:64 stop:1095 length:1032 start_codon:yes stop_codon:yes gene_type:complete